MDLSQVTLTQMRYAVAVADARSFRRAAEQCHVSQSGLSMQVQKLEDLLDAVLFDRSRKPVLVTPEGEVALGQMRAILGETERLGQLLADRDDVSGPYRLGVIPTLAASVLPLILRELITTHPRLELTIEELQTDDILARLQADTLDAGLASTPLLTPGLRETALAEEPLLAYLPRGDKLLKKKAVTEADLADRELWLMPEGHCFRTQVLALCKMAQDTAAARIHFESGSFETLMRLVDDGLGATVIPELVAQQLTPGKRKAHVRPIAAPVPVREIGLVTARTDMRGRVNTAVVELVRRRLEDALGAGSGRRLRLSPIDA